VYSTEQVRQVKALIANGLRDPEIAALTGIPRPTVNRWRHGRSVPKPRPAPRPWRLHHPAHYCYLLGLYLGDGCLWVGSRYSATLTVSLDAVYPGIVAEAARALREIASPAKVHERMRPPDRVIVLQASSPIWLQAFPQHGPGRKHTRRIELVPWQQELTTRHPKMLIRGLIHSDGCRTVNRFKTKLPSARVAEYEYPRYFFSNLSADIRRIFTDHCELLGIRWTQSNHRNISISHRHSVALLDTFVGPKS
jgi:Homeodomain-like domain-containing protein